MFCANQPFICSGLKPVIVSWRFRRKAPIFLSDTEHHIDIYTDRYRYNKIFFYHYWCKHFLKNQIINSHKGDQPGNVGLVWRKVSRSTNTQQSKQKSVITFSTDTFFFLSSASFLYFHTFHQCSLFLFLSTHLRFTLHLFQSTSAAAAFPWRRASQQVCGRWGSVRHPRRNSSAVRTRTRLWAPSRPSLSPPRASAAPVPAAGRATATCATVTRSRCFTPALLWPSVIQLFSQTQTALANI